MPRKVSVGIMFDFYPDSDDQHLFQNMTPDEQLNWARNMAKDDIELMVTTGELIKNMLTETEGEPD